MKKLTALLLALTLVLSLCVPVHAASGMVFDLTATNASTDAASEFDSADSENWFTNVKKGDRITVSLRVSASPAVKTRIIESDISFNNDFFKVVSHATTAEGKLNGFGNSSCLTNGDGVKFIRFSSISDNDYTADGTVIGTVVLEVIGNSGKSEVYCTNYGAIYYTGGRVPASTQNLSVCFGDKPPECSLEFESNGGTPVSTITLKKGRTATLPSTSKAFYNFVGWSLPESDEIYKAGSSITVDKLYFHFSAVWDAVSAPDAPENLTAVRTTDPDMQDGRITGVTTAMEYSADDGESWTACAGSEIRGLSAGTYCVRYREDPKKGAGTPAGEIAYVTILDGPRADAPTGLSAVQESLVGAGDGKLIGTDSTMEYSVSEYFSTGVKRCGNGTTTGLTGGITYYVRYAKTATRGASKTAEVVVPVGKRPEAPTSPKGVSTSLKGLSDGKLTGLTTAMEYSTNGKSWTSCTGSELTGLKAGSTYYVRYQAVSATNTAASKETTIVIGEGGLRDAPASVRGVQTSRPSAADGRLTGTSASMEYSADGTKWTTCAQSEVTGLKAGTYYVRLKAEGDLPAGNIAAVAVNPGQVPAPAAPTGIRAIQESLPGAKNGRIVGVTAEMEYSTDPNSGKWTACKGTEITGLSAGSYFVRLKANATTEAPAGEIAEVQLRAGSQGAAPDDLVCVLPSRPGKADGIVAGTTDKMEWSTSETGSKWAACEAGATGGFAAGTYYFRYQADAATNTVASKCLEIVMEDPEFLLDGELSGLVEFSASVSGSTATVKNIDSEQLENALYSGYLELDLSELGKEVDSVKLPGTLFTRAADDAFSCSVEITLSNASIDFDAAAVASIAKQSSGKEISLSLKGKDSSALNTAQTEAIKSLDVSTAFTISLGAGKQITDFGTGTVTIDVPFTVPAGKLAEGYSVWHIAEDGKTEKMPTAYRNGALRFVVPHFSDYVVVYEKPPVSFTDVVPGSYYENAVAWAVENGVTTGTSATTFSPNASTTRAQVVTFLWRAAGQPVVDYDMSFRDVPSDYYTEAVRWAVSKGITTGTSADTFSPNAVCTRGQIVTFLARYMGAGEVAAQNPFVDVLPGMYYTSPVLWALANGVTSGKTPTTFVPDGICTRAEVVTFLWRCVN